MNVLELARQHNEALRKAAKEKPSSSPRIHFGMAYRRPLKSRALGCHPAQVEIFREDAKRRGITGYEIDNKGNAAVTTKGQRNKVLKARGVVDLDGHGM